MYALCHDKIQELGSKHSPRSPGVPQVRPEHDCTIYLMPL